jgi:hypothetical protein
MASAPSALFFEGLSLLGGMPTTVDADPTESYLRFSGRPLFSLSLYRFLALPLIPRVCSNLDWTVHVLYP